MSATRPRAGPRRCPWAGTDPLYVAYHDAEWGVPVHGEQELFELLTLEGFQAGLSWLTILRKREAFRRAFAGFDVDAVARFGPARVEALLRDPGIVRHRGKIEAAIGNARAVRRLRREVGSVDRWLWSFVGGAPVVGRYRTIGEVPARTPESEALSRALRARGFAFVGPTTCQAFLQAAGMRDDHLLGCFRRAGAVRRGAGKR